MQELQKFLLPLKKNKYILIVICVGILFLVLPSSGSDDSGEKQNPIVEFSLEECEKRIERILEKTKGVGRVEVALAVSGTVESVYAEESRVNTHETEGNYDEDRDLKPSIISDGAGGEEPVILKHIYPEFLGATIVCDGADSPVVCMSIIQAVSSLTGISSERITVIKMKN